MRTFISALFVLSIAIGCNNKSDTTERVTQDTLIHTSSVDTIIPGPHGGRVQPANYGYHIEMVLDVNNVSFYPLNRNGDAMNLSGWSGQVVLDPSGKSVSLPLEAQNGKLSTSHLEAGVAFDAEVSLTKGDSSLKAFFKYPRKVNSTN